MTKLFRDELIKQSLGSTSSDTRSMLLVSEWIGDDNIIEIDWDELQESTGLRDNEQIEEVLQLMYDLNVLDILSFEDGELG